MEIIFSVVLVSGVVFLAVNLVIAILDLDYALKSRK